MSRRRAFGAAVAVLGLSYAEAAERLGVTYNHLVLVVDGTRVGSARLESELRAMLDEAKPVLRAIADGACDAPPPRPPRRARAVHAPASAPGVELATGDV